MIKIYCDICGKQLNEDCSNQVNLDFNAYGTSGFKPMEINLCVECVNKVVSDIEELRKGFESDGKS